MPATLQKIKRVYEYNNLKLDDIDGMSPEEVKDFYSNIYPQLTQAETDGPELKNDTEVYVFRKAVGTKGITVRELAAGKGLPMADMSSKNIALMTNVAAALCTAAYYSDDEGVSSFILPPGEVLEVL
jgi:PRTRC genetic system protein C